MRRAQKALTATLRLALRAIGKDIAGKVCKHLGLGKAEDPTDDADKAAKSAIAGADWAPVAGAAKTHLVDVAKDGARRTLAVLGVSDDESITEQTFDEAADWAEERAAQLVGKSWDEDGNLVDNPDAQMAITDSLGEEIQAAVADAIEQGDSAADLAETLQGLAGFSADRAELIARTECLVGETPVCAAVVRAAYRRWYHGDVVELITAAGRKLTATPNHPMLTRRGWIAAGEITYLDDLICDDRKQDPGSNGDQDENGAPTTIAQVFCSLLETGSVERYPGTSLEFHGDGMDSDVDVARAHGELTLGRFAQISQPIANRLFPEADLARATLCHYCGTLLPVDKRACFSCGAQRDTCTTQPADNSTSMDIVASAELDERQTLSIKGDNILDWQTVPERRSDVSARVLGHGGALPVAHHAPAAQGKDNAVIPDAERGGDLGGAHAGGVQRDDSIDIDRATVFCKGCGASVAVDSGLDKYAAKPLIREPKPLGDDMTGDAGFVKFDRVTFIKRARFTGHVFNLETPCGYFCIAGGAYTGNTIRAHGQGQLAAFRQSGVVERKGWSTSEDGDVCEDCTANEDEGDIALEDDFQSGDDAPPAHPNCRCALVAVFPPEEEDTTQDDEEEAAQ